MLLMLPLLLLMEPLLPQLVNEAASLKVTD